MTESASKNRSECCGKDAVSSAPSPSSEGRLERKRQRVQLLKELAQDLTNIISLLPPTTLLGRGLREYSCCAFHISARIDDMGQTRPRPATEQNNVENEILLKIEQALQDLTGETFCEQEKLHPQPVVESSGDLEANSRRGEIGGAASSSQARSCAFDDLADAVLDFAELPQ